MKQAVIVFAAMILAGCASDTTELPRLTVFYGYNTVTREPSVFMQSASVVVRCSRADAPDPMRPLLRQVCLTDGGSLPVLGSPVEIDPQPDAQHQRPGDEVVVFFLRTPDTGLALYCGVEVFGKSIPAWDMTLAELEQKMEGVEQHRGHLQNTPRGRGLF